MKSKTKGKLESASILFLMVGINFIYMSISYYALAWLNGKYGEISVRTVFALGIVLLAGSIIALKKFDK